MVAPTTKDSTKSRGAEPHLETKMIILNRSGFTTQYLIYSSMFCIYKTLSSPNCLEICKLHRNISKVLIASKNLKHNTIMCRLARKIISFKTMR